MLQFCGLLTQRRLHHISRIGFNRVCYDLRLLVFGDLQLDLATSLPYRFLCRTDHELSSQQAQVPHEHADVDSHFLARWLVADGPIELKLSVFLPKIVLLTDPTVIHRNRLRRRPKVCRHWRCVEFVLPVANNLTASSFVSSICGGEPGDDHTGLQWLITAAIGPPCFARRRQQL